MKEKEYLYMKETTDGHTYCIMYHLGKYAVVRRLRGETGTMYYTMRQYKTISGAERYLRDNITSPASVKVDKGGLHATKCYYGTLKEIQEGEYWR